MAVAGDGNVQYRQKRAPKQWQVALILSILTISCYLQRSASQLLDSQVTTKGRFATT